MWSLLIDFLVGAVIDNTCHSDLILIKIWHLYYQGTLVLLHIYDVYLVLILVYDFISYFIILGVDNKKH